MSTTRKVLISGEVPETGPRGYRSRRLSIGENAIPTNAWEYQSLKPHVESPQLDDPASEQPARTKRRVGLIRLAFNVMIGILIWIYAISPHYNNFKENLNPQTSDARSSTPPPEHAVELVQPPPPPPPPLPVSDLHVMSEIRGVKDQISMLQREIKQKTSPEEDPLQLARDAELEKMRAVVRDLEQRLNSLVDEAKALTRSTTAPPKVAPVPRSNVANSHLGAVIWREKTTPTKNSARWLLNYLQPWLKRTARYGESMDRAEKLPGPEVVLDEHPVRGHGDGFCVETPETGMFSVGIRLPYEVYVRAIELEYVRPELDPLPEFRPHSAVVEAYDHVERHVDTAEFPLAFNELGIFAAPLSFTDPTERLVVRFRAQELKSGCIYRIRVFGDFKKTI